MKLVKAGVVLCLAAFLFGGVCMTLVAVMGEGEDPPIIFQQMGGASCALFAAGIVLSLVGWIVSLSRSDPPASRMANPSPAGNLESETDDELAAPATEESPAPGKPDPYASYHRRRDI